MRASGNVGEKAESPLVDADQRDVVGREAPCDRQHRAVAAQHDDEIGIRADLVGGRGGVPCGTGRARRLLLEHHRVAAGGEEARQAHEGLRGGARVTADQRDAWEPDGGRRHGKD